LNVPSRPLLSEGLQTATGILRLRKGPEDMPTSTGLMWTFLVIDVVMRLVASALIDDQVEYGSAPVIVAIDLAILFIGVKVALMMAMHPERFTQTFTALLGCHVVLLPALLAGQWMQVTYINDQGMAGFAMFLTFLVALWYLVAAVRILRSATGWPTFATVMLVLSIELLAGGIILAIYPPPAEALATPT
jgi:hypothetical protein